jgi:hypothetical protein
MYKLMMFGTLAKTITLTRDRIVCDGVYLKRASFASLAKITELCFTQISKSLLHDFSFLPAHERDQVSSTTKEPDQVSMYHQQKET